MRTTSRRSSENPTRNSPFFRAPAIEVSLVPRAVRVEIVLVEGLRTKSGTNYQATCRRTPLQTEQAVRGLDHNAAAAGRRLA